MWIFYLFSVSNVPLLKEVFLNPAIKYFLIKSKKIREFNGCFIHKLKTFFIILFFWKTNKQLLTVNDNVPGLRSSRLADFLFWNLISSSVDPFPTNGTSRLSELFLSVSVGEWRGDPTLRMTSGVDLVATSGWFCQ